AGPTDASGSTSRGSTTSWCGSRGAAPRGRATRSSAASPPASACATRRAADIGLVPRGRRVSVHRADCANAVALSTTEGQEGRLIEVEWDAEPGGTYVVAVQVEALDRSRLLRDVAEVMADYHVNILGCTTTTSSDRVATLRFDFELADPGHLTTIIAAVKRVDSVSEPYR